jgi:hypothetical protein
MTDFARHGARWKTTFRNSIVSDRVLLGDFAWIDRLVWWIEICEKHRSLMTDRRYQSLDLVLGSAVRMQRFHRQTGAPVAAIKLGNLGTYGPGLWWTVSPW